MTRKTARAPVCVGQDCGDGFVESGSGSSCGLIVHTPRDARDFAVGRMQQSFLQADSTRRDHTLWPSHCSIRRNEKCVQTFVQTERASLTARLDWLPRGDVTRHAFADYDTNVRSAISASGPRSKHVERRSGKRHVDAMTWPCTCHCQPGASEMAGRSMKWPVQVAVELEPQVPRFSRLPASHPEQQSPHSTLLSRRQS